MFSFNLLRLGSRVLQTRTFSSVVRKTVEFKTPTEVYRGTGKLGDSILDVMIDNDIPLDGFGACEGTLACCTCHVILKQDHYDRLDKTNPPSEEELDMLDLAPDLTDQSRLGCQIKLEACDEDVVTVVIPSSVRDARTI